MSHFQLCKFSDGVSALADLDVLLDDSKADPFPATYAPYAEIVGTDTYGQPVKMGLPTAHWHWDWLPQVDVDTLLDTEGHVYVRTELRTGNIRSFDIFDAYLVVADIGEPMRSENGTPFYGQARGPIEIDFTSMVAT